MSNLIEEFLVTPSLKKSNLFTYCSVYPIGWLWMTDKLTEDKDSRVGGIMKFNNIEMKIHS